LVTAAPSALDGDWEYRAPEKDPDHHDPAGFLMSVRVKGEEICGAFTSFTRDGRKVDGGSFLGRFNQSGSVVYFFNGGFVENAEIGIARLSFTHDHLVWEVVRPLHVENYILPNAAMRRGTVSHELPASCK
jgi:hypothetical protein